MSVLQPNWDDKEIEIETKEDFLNGLKYEDVSDLQKMIYILYKEIEKLKLLLLQTLSKEVK